MPIIRRAFKRVTQPPRFWLIYALSVTFTFHGLLVAYSNSTYMERFISPEAVGALYTIGSALAVLIFLFISRILRKVGNVPLTLGLIGIETTALLTLGLAHSPHTLIVAFVLFLILNPLLYMNIDIFSETLIGENEGATGSRRGLALTLMSLAAVAAPLSLGAIVGEDNMNLPRVYLVAAAIGMLFIGIVLTHFRNFEDPEYTEMQVLSALRSFFQHRNVRNVFLAHFTLQIFFSWMVIYVPLYLATKISFSWHEIGTIIATGLFAYVLLEYPIGLLADRYLGEKEMMASGFLVLAVSASWISFMSAASLTGWMVLMFMSRSGASLVEVTTESYFFKHTRGSDANIISFFRLSRPLAMVVGSLLGSAALLYLPFEFIFVVLGLLMIPGIFCTMALEDTR